MAETATDIPDAIEALKSVLLARGEEPQIVVNPIGKPIDPTTLS